MKLKNRENPTESRCAVTSFIERRIEGGLEGMLRELAKFMGKSTD